MKTSELIGSALDWAVVYVRCLEATNGKPVLARDMANRAYKNGICEYSTDWAQGGPIIEREKITIAYLKINEVIQWEARYFDDKGRFRSMEYGTTPLIAAMRCFCASKLGDEIEIPEELK